MMLKKMRSIFSSVYGDVLLCCSRTCRSADQYSIERRSVRIENHLLLLYRKNGLKKLSNSGGISSSCHLSVTDKHKVYHFKSQKMFFVSYLYVFLYPEQLFF